MTRGIAIVLLCLGATTACKRLKTGALEQFATTYSCPEDRVVVTARDDLHYGDLVLSSQPGPPPDEVARDPGRLAKWRSDHQAKDDELRSELNSNLSIFEARGCDHAARLGCGHPSVEDGSMDLGRVNCFEVPERR